MELNSENVCVAVFLVTLLPATVLSCEGTRITGEAGQQARIPCTFTGDMRNLYWFYQENEGMDRKKVLTYFKQELTYHGDYTSDHVQLDVETSTLVIMSVSIADEGIYMCDVDRINQTAVLDIVSCLDVFATPFKPFPRVTECNAIGQDEICNLSFSAETETNITCILSGFYPDGRATLEWLHQDLVHESSVKEDEMYILTIRSTVPREGNYTCEASYVLPNGTVTTGRKQVFFKEMEVKNAWSTGQIAGVIVAILTAIIIIIITIWILWGKRKREELPLGQPGEGASSPEERTTDSNVSRRKNGEKHESGDAPGSDSNEPSGTEKENLSENYPLLPQGQPGEGTSSPEERTTDTDVSLGTNAEKQQPEAPENDSSDLSGSKKEESSMKGPLPSKQRPEEGKSSSEERISDTADISRRQQIIVTSEQIFKLSTILPPSKYDELAGFLGFKYSESENIKHKHHLDTKGALIELLNAWKTKNRGFIHDLDKALVKASCGGLVEQYKSDSSSQ